MTNREVIIVIVKQLIIDTKEYPTKKVLRYMNECVRGLGLVDWLKKNRPSFYLEGGE